LGRGLATERAYRHEAVAALRTAEKLAPQRVRANPFVRDVITDLMRRARRDAIGRELRGMAYRMASPRTDRVILPKRQARDGDRVHSRQS
jgi:hypothetical protein